MFLRCTGYYLLTINIWSHGFDPRRVHFSEVFLDFGCGFLVSGQRSRVAVEFLSESFEFALEEAFVMHEFFFLRLAAAQFALKALHLLVRRYTLAVEGRLQRCHIFE